MIEKLKGLLQTKHNSQSKLAHAKQATRDPPASKVLRSSQLQWEHSNLPKCLRWHKKFYLDHSSPWTPQVLQMKSSSHLMRIFPKSSQVSKMLRRSLDNQFTINSSIPQILIISSQHSWLPLFKLTFLFESPHICKKVVYH